MTLPHLTLAGAIAAAVGLAFAVRWPIRRARIDVLPSGPVGLEHAVELQALTSLARQCAA